MGHYQCYANITADTDIGGPGVMSSFLVVSWATIAISGVFAIHELHEWIRKHGRVDSEEEEETRDSNKSKKARFPRLREVLHALCDLQIITGLGVMICGWSQALSIEYYHQQLVNLYWTLTLNSFASSRVNHVGFNDDGQLDDGWKSISRRVILFFSGALAVAFQIRVIARERGTWDNGDGPCYNHLDHTSSIPWISGLIVYCVALISLIVPKLRPLNSMYLDFIKDRRKLLKERFNRQRAVFTQAATDVALCPSFREMRKLVFVFGRTSLFCIHLVIFLLIAQYLEVWAYGDGFYPLTWLILNAHLIMDNEQRNWGFGQVLPWAMNITILLNFVDTFFTW
ncbi:hypothetical protein BC826DRAFT_985839 [Russula brevipes]|nr:hypothetical protein BC826DRAFT_985839 [Russula brevipes]